MSFNPTITHKEEYEAFARMFTPYYLEYLRSYATAVDDIEIYSGDDSLTGVNSLPARLDFGGVRKTVLVPIEILGRDARAAAEEARAAAGRVDETIAKSEAATAQAMAAAQEADRARDDLEMVKSLTLAAANRANEAADRANSDLEQAEAKMQEFEAQEAIREAAEALREDSFKSALAGFLADAAQEIESFKADYSVLLQRAEEFLDLINQNEEERKVAESLRESAEVERERKTTEALTKLDESLKEFREELDESVKHSQIKLLQPDDIRKMWQSICSENSPEEEG